MVKLAAVVLLACCVIHAEDAKPDQPAVVYRTVASGKKRLNALLDRLKELAENLQTAYDTGDDPAPVVFPSGHVRNESRKVLPRYIALIKDRIAQLEQKIQMLP